MKKVTINEVVVAVIVANTLEAIQTVLEHCTKPQLHEVFLAVTSLEKELAPKSWKKEIIASYYAKEIVAYKAREAFKTMTAEEKAEYVKGCNPFRDNNRLDDLLRLCSLYELFVINARLGGTYKEYEELHTKYFWRKVKDLLEQSIHTRMSWITMIANSKERKVQSKISNTAKIQAETNSAFKGAALSYLKEHTDVEVSYAEGEANMMKDALAYAQKHAELEESLSHETQTENDVEVENPYLRAKEVIKATTFTAEQCKVISDLKAKIKSKGLKDGCDDMTVSQYIWRELETKGYKGIITWDEAYNGVRDFLSIFGVTGIEALDAVECLSLIDCVSYWVGEQIYNSIQQADTEIEISTVEASTTTTSEAINENSGATEKSARVKAINCRKLTTQQVLEALANADTHEERLAILKSAGMKKMREIGVIEKIAHFDRGWTIETLAPRILKTIESRYTAIDNGESIMIAGLFGMPMVIDTYLLRKRREHAASQAQEVIVAADNESYDDAPYTPDYEVNEAVLQDTPEQEYSGDYSLPFASNEQKERKLQAQPSITKFEVGKWYRKGAVNYGYMEEPARITARNGDYVTISDPSRKNPIRRKGVFFTSM